MILPLKRTTVFPPVAAVQVVLVLSGLMVAAQKAERPLPLARDPHTPSYVGAKELPDGEVPSADVDGNFILGPTHNPSPEVDPEGKIVHGTVVEFTMNSADSKFYPGIGREPNTFGTPDPEDAAKLIVTTSHPASYTRKVAVYVPKEYVPGTAAPFIVSADGPDSFLFATLDGLIAKKKLPSPFTRRSR